MEVADIVQIISSLGFPIAACIALFWQNNRVMQNLTDRIEKSMENLSTTISENTKATVTLVTTVETLSKEGD